MFLNRVLWQLLRNMLSYILYLLFIAAKVYKRFHFFFVCLRIYSIFIYLFQQCHIIQTLNESSSVYMVNKE